MSVDERIEAALASDECAGVGTLLTALVYSLRVEGLSKQQIGAALFEAHKRLQAAGREADADEIGDVLDLLVGGCSPSKRLLPDEPDVKL